MLVTVGSRAAVSDSGYIDAKGYERKIRKAPRRTERGGPSTPRTGSSYCTSVRPPARELNGTALSQEEVAGGLEARFADLRRRMRLDQHEATVAMRLVYAGTGAYALLFVSPPYCTTRYSSPRGLDLGNMVQPIWNTLHGHFLETTTVSGNQRSRLGFHVDPFLVLLAPLFLIWSSPLVLPVLQAVAVASGALPVFWLARKHLDSPRAGALFAFAYLLYPATQFNAFTITSSFHSVSIAVHCCSTPCGSSTRTDSSRSRPSRCLPSRQGGDPARDRLPRDLVRRPQGSSAVRARRVRGRPGRDAGSTSFGSYRTSRPCGRRPVRRPLYVRWAGRLVGSPTSSSPTRRRSSTPRRPAIRPSTSSCYWCHSSASGCSSRCWYSAPCPTSRSTSCRASPDQTMLNNQYTGGNPPLHSRREHLRRHALQAPCGPELSLWALAATAAVAVYSPLLSIRWSEVRALGSPFGLSQSACGSA